MNICPVMQGINAAALSDERQADRQERISERADDLAYHISQKQAKEMLDKHFEDTGGETVTEALARLLTCRVDRRQNAFHALDEACKDAMRPYLLEMATAQIDEGKDAWGDAA